MASNNQLASHNLMETDKGAAPSNETEADKPGRKKPSTEFQLKKYLMLLATLVATVTYVAGLNLPGGVWQDTQQDRPAGDPILPHAHRRRYYAFYYCNATAFAASLVVCLLLLVLDEGSTGWAVVLQVVMALDLLGLMGAYAAGSCRDKFTTIYSSVLIFAVFFYVVLAFSRKVICWPSRKKNKDDNEKQSEEDNEKQSEEDNERQSEDRQELHEALMLLATFAVTITYVAGLNPPGGFWGNTQDGHLASDPILQDHYSRRYQAFFVCNTTSFVASLLIIILLLDKELRMKLTPRFIFLYGLIVIALFGLVGAYTAGSSRERDNTSYVVGLAVAVLAWIFVQVAITKYMKKDGTASKYLPSRITFFARGTNSGRVEKANDLAMEKERDLVMLLATLVASITYQAGLDPPGGFWADDRDGHKSGDPVLLKTHYTRYMVFFYSNSAAFVTSLVVIIMVQSRFLLTAHTLEAAMILDLFGLIGAYAAGSCRDVSTSIYVVAIAGAVLVYVVIHIIFFTLDHTDNPQDSVHELDNRREVLLLLAILAATLTYQAGLTPPGGFWSVDDKSGHHAGFPTLLDNHPSRYEAFFYCNATSFMASVALIVLLVNPNLYRPGIKCYAFYVCMVAGMFGLMGAYAAGSSRRLRTSIYVLILVVVVFVFVTMQVAIFWIKKTRPQHMGPVLACKPVAWWRTSLLHLPENNTTQNKESTVQERHKDLREYLMLLGILAASVTYQTGLKPPGGLWQDNNNGHYAGNSLLHDINKRRYLAFFYCNSTSFMASIVVIILLLPRMLHDYKLPLWPMHTAILLDMLGLLGAYAAGSTRDWGTSWKVILLIIPVLAYIAVYAAVFVLRKKKDNVNS